MSEEPRAPTGGGRATAGGMSFQSRVAAYYCVAVLAEREAQPPLTLPANATLDFVRCETEQPVDDVLVGASNGGHIFGQAKRALDLSKEIDSPLYSVARQFVGQFLSNRGQSKPVAPWTAPLNRTRDRLAAMVGPRSSEAVRVSLAQGLNSIRRLQPSQAVTDAGSNAAERSALSVFTEHLRSAWTTATGSSPDDAEIRLLLSLSYVTTLAVEDEGPDEQLAKDRLRRSILVNPTEADAAWDRLIRFSAALQKVLLDAGFRIKTPSGYLADVTRLLDLTRRSLDLIEPLARIQLGQRTIHLSRASSDHLCRAALEGSLLVVGQPGAGKSGCIRDFCRYAQTNHFDLLLVLVDRLSSDTRDPLKVDLGLEHDLADVLRSWPGEGPAFLVFDALDAARDEHVSRRVRDTIATVLAANTRWRVIASIRKFDLRYGVNLAKLFHLNSTNHGPYTDPEFARTAHLDVPRLSQSEVDTLCSESSELAALWEATTEGFRDLLRVPFNMRLAADLLGEGVAMETLSVIRTQLDLLERYWIHRVIGDDKRGDDRERLLLEVCEHMVDGRTLQANRTSLKSMPIG